MKVTEEGQISLPPEVAARLGFLPDTELDYFIQGETLLLKKSQKADRGKKLISTIKGTAKAGLTTDEILQATRGE